MNCLRNSLNRFVAVAAFSAFVALASGFAPAAWSAALVSQPFADGNASFLSAGAGSGAENADSFNLSGGASVTSIVWWGSVADISDESYFEVVLGDALTNFGAPLAGSVSVAAAVAGQDAGDPLFGQPARDIYRFEKTLACPLVFGAGRHFLSVGYTQDFWFWAAGLQDLIAGVNGSFFLDSAGWVGDDTFSMSFEIVG